MCAKLLRHIFCSTLSNRSKLINKIVNDYRIYNTSISRAYSQFEKHAHSFGHEDVTPAEKRGKVQAVFSEVASKYDFMNDVMSMGIHRFWKDYFISKLAPTPGLKVLDVAGGTGDIAFRLLTASVENDDIPLDSMLLEAKYDSSSHSHVVVLDMNDKMLAICKEKSTNAGLNKYLTCVQGNAEILPFEDNSFDAYTIAFGIRNVVHIDQALSEAFRVLRKGGRFLCLEFSEVKNPIINRAYEWYSQEAIPVLGQVLAGNWKAYQYLVESIQRFPRQDDFAIMIEDAGFSGVTYENLSNGIASIHSGYKL